MPTPVLTTEEIAFADAKCEHVFPAIEGVQAGRQFYVTMCPLWLVPRLFLFDDAELTPELRAQRTLNKKRVPEIASYITDNPEDYVFSAITASVDGPMVFESHGAIGRLRIDMPAKFLINDGQHRRAAIEQALVKTPTLAKESIAVVFFQDEGLVRSQQMFADLNRNAIRPSPSIGVLYDQRDELASVVREFIAKSEFFSASTDLEASGLSARSQKLFTLSALYRANAALLGGHARTRPQQLEAIENYWSAVVDVMPTWRDVHEGKITAGQVRTATIQTHGIVTHALGIVGNAVIASAQSQKSARKTLAPLGEVDWARDNKFWEGKAMVAGRISKSGMHLRLTAGALLRLLNLPLTPELSLLLSSETHERGAPGGQ